MRGIRLPDAILGEPGPGWEAWEGKGPFSKENPRKVIAPPGSYMKTFVRHDGEEEPRLFCWYAIMPSGIPCSIGFDNHTVEEHEDGTITVSPSIWDYPDGYHGFLIKGEWSGA